MCVWYVMCVGVCGGGLCGFGWWCVCVVCGAWFVVCGCERCVCGMWCCVCVWCVCVWLRCGDFVCVWYVYVMCVVDVCLWYVWLCVLCVCVCMIMVWDVCCVCVCGRAPATSGPSGSWVRLTLSGRSLWGARLAPRITGGAQLPVRPLLVLIGAWGWAVSAGVELHADEGEPRGRLYWS